MMEAIFCLVASLRSVFRDRRELSLENIALRQQLAILARTHPHRRLRKTDRLFWVWLSRMWKSWQQSLIVIEPDTVVRWYRKGPSLYWTRLSRENHTGRPGTRKEIRDLVRKVALANPPWGGLRVHGELLKLDVYISERTVARLRPKRKKPPSQTWRVFLDNHLLELVSIDFLVVPTATFRILFVLIVLARHVDA